MTLNQRCLILSYERGYRIKNGKIYFGGKRLKGYYNRGYHFFSMRDHLGNPQSVAVHRLIGFQKYGKEIFKKGIELRHKDGNRANNREPNILIGTHYDNMMDKKPAERKRLAVIATAFSRKHNHHKIIQMHKRGCSYEYIMEQLGIKSKGTISYIIRKSMASEKFSSRSCMNRK